MRKSKSREEVDIGSERREKGDLLPCSSPVSHVFELRVETKFEVYDPRSF